MSEETTSILSVAPMKDFHCRTCHAPLGQTNGFQLLCGDNAIFTLKVTITCRKCGQIRMWRPLMPTPPKKPAVLPVPVLHLNSE